MDLVRFFTQIRYELLKHQFPNWKLSFSDTFGLFFDFKKYSIIRFKPEVLEKYGRIKYKDFIIPGKLLSKVLKWYQENSSRI